MKLSLQGIQSPEYLEKGYLLPAFDVAKMAQRTKTAPTWLHFGAGNILRAFPCVLCQKLLDAGATDRGMIVVETYDEEIIDKAFTPFDNLCLAVSLKSDGRVEKRVVASVAEALGYRSSLARVREVFTSDSLQMVSMTITEKGYGVGETDNFDAPETIMGILARLLYERYLAGAKPIAMVSMDNCSHNGTILYASVRRVAGSWAEKGLVRPDFLAYLDDPAQVSFPWSMIDKITPRPSPEVMQMLVEEGFKDAELVVTGKRTFVSGMVNAEECEYLAIEDSFPAGRPPLEKAGVIFDTRDTVNRIEKMKVCTCLNPLHTFLAVFGCLLGYSKICEEMKDRTLVRLVEKLGYDEGMPVVCDPGVMSADTFIREVLTLRLPNPYMPDSPQRIVCDTSKKLPVRFGETLKAYLAAGKEDLGFLTCIPLAFAGYARYLTGIGDEGDPFELSPDPNLPALTPLLEGFRLGMPFDTERLRPLFENEEFCGVDLYACGLGRKAESMFLEMCMGVGAVRKTLEKYAV